jgi:hypothetical protein
VSGRHGFMPTCVRRNGLGRPPPAYRTAERREATLRSRGSIGFAGVSCGAGLAAEQDQMSMMESGLVSGGTTLRLPESALPGSRLGLPAQLSAPGSLWVARRVAAVDGLARGVGEAVVLPPATDPQNQDHATQAELMAKPRVNAMRPGRSRRSCIMKGDCRPTTVELPDSGIHHDDQRSLG